MNIFKALFGTKEQDPEEKRKEGSARQFDVFKYDGVRALKSRQPAYAVECFRRAIEIEDDLECRDYLSQALMQTGELAASYEQLSVLAERQPDNQRIFLRMAELSYMMENYVAMSDDCEKALLIDNSNPQVYLLYARACHGHGDDVNAEAMLTKAVALKDDLYDAYLLRGEIRLSAGDMDGAQEDCSLLLSKIEDNEDILLFAGRMEMARKEYQKASDVFSKVLDVDPFCIAALRERAAAKASLGDEEGAAADTNAADELDSKDGLS